MPSVVPPAPLAPAKELPSPKTPQVLPDSTFGSRPVSCGIIEVQPQVQQVGQASICTMCAGPVTQSQQRLRDSAGLYTHARCRFPHIPEQQFALLNREMNKMLALNMPVHDAVEVLMESPAAPRLLEQGAIDSMDTLRRNLTDIFCFGM